MLENGSIKDRKEKEKLEFLLRTKRWNPYCLRHSAITYDSDHLPEYAIKKKVRWSMNGRQGSRYIKARMGPELKRTILAQNGISMAKNESLKAMASVHECPRCNLVNVFENKYCSKCSYPLIPEAFDEIKEAENSRLRTLEEKQQRDLNILREEMNQQFNEILECLKYPERLAEISNQD